MRFVINTEEMNVTLEKTRNPYGGHNWIAHCEDTEGTEFAVAGNLNVRDLLYRLGRESKAAEVETRYVLRAIAPDIEETEDFYDSIRTNKVLDEYRSRKEFFSSAA